MLLVALVVSARCNDGARMRMIVEVAHLIYAPAWCVFNTPCVLVSRHSRARRHSSTRKPSKPGSHTRRGRHSSVRKPTRDLAVPSIPSMRTMSNTIMV